MISSAFPLSDIALGARWAMGVVIMLWLPGHLMFGRGLRRWDFVTSAVVSLLTGVLLFSLVNMIVSLLGAPIRWWVSGSLALLVAVLLGRAHFFRQYVAGLENDLEPLTRGPAYALGALFLLMLALISSGQSHYCAAPAFFDPNNHSFLAKCIFESGSIDPEKFIPPPFQALGTPYLVGWHSVAAVLSDMTNIAPYISIWYMSVLAAALFPLTYSVFWRLCGLRSGGTLVGALLVSACYYNPVGIYAWGGFGAIVGMALLPLIVLLSRQMWSQRSSLSAVVAGLAIVAMIHIHTTEAFVAVFLLWPAVKSSQGTDVTSAAKTKIALVFLSIVLLAGILPLLNEVSAYRSLVGDMQSVALVNLKSAVTATLLELGGRLTALKIVAVAALAVGWVPKATRRLYVACWLVLILHLFLRVAPNPVSRFLAVPFYGQAARLLYLGPLLVYPLWGAVSDTVMKWSRPKMPAWTLMAATSTVAVLLTVFVLVPGWKYSHGHLEGRRSRVVFDGADYEMARDLMALEPKAGRIANMEADGSFWAMHVSGREFLDPCSWNLAGNGSRLTRPIMPLLKDRPWPQSVWSLREMGVHFLWVSDKITRGALPLLTRDMLAGDPRFEVLLTSENSTVYRINWDAGVPAVSE